MFVTEVVEMLHKINFSIISSLFYQWVFQIVWPISHKCKTYIHFFQESGFITQYVIKSLPNSLFTEITKTGFETYCSAFLYNQTISSLWQLGELYNWQ